MPERSYRHAVPADLVALTLRVQADERATRAEQLSEAARLSEQLRQQQQLQIEENLRLRTEMEILQSDSLSFAKLQKQVKAAFPEVQGISFGHLQSTDFAKTDQNLPMVIVQWEPGYRNRAFRAKEVRLDTFLRSTLAEDTLHIVSIRNLQ